MEQIALTCISTVARDILQSPLLPHSLLREEDRRRYCCYLLLREVSTTWAPTCRSCTEQRYTIDISAQ